MVSAFASQLQTIAKNSSHELDLKARRKAHAESLLFERTVAVKQDYETIYNICSEGFRELCQLDSRFHDFGRNLFSEQAKDQDRDQMTKSENEALDLVLKRCLMLLGGRVLLKPALKALEWLVRRFRVHIHNVDDLLHTLLPYHEVAVWANVVSIVPNDKIVGQWKFIRPYLKTTWNIPRHAIAYAAANNDGFFAALNTYVLEACRHRMSHTVLMRFWSSLIVEAIANRIDQTRSGRKEVQAQRTEDLMYKLLPLLSEAYELPGSIDLTTTCYTISILLAAKAEMADNVLDSLLLEAAHTLTRVEHDAIAAFITMSVLVISKEDSTMPKKTVDILARLESFGQVIRSVSKDHSCLPFLIALVKSATAHAKRKNAHKFVSLVQESVELVRELYPASQLSEVLRPVITRTLSLTENELETRNGLVAALQGMNDIEALSAAIWDAARAEGHDTAALESILGMTVTLPRPAPEPVNSDIDMLDMEISPQTTDNVFETVPSKWEGHPSCLAHGVTHLFRPLATAFADCWNTPATFDGFAALPVWATEPSPGLLWQTFLLRFACTGEQDQARAKSIRLLSQSVREQPACDIQHFVPYAVALLCETKMVRKAAADLLVGLLSTSDADTQDSRDIYDAEHAKMLHRVQPQQMSSLVEDVFVPILEECVLDPTYASTAVRHALQPLNKQDIKKSHSQALFSILTQHALATPILKLRIRVMAMLENVEKVGGKSKRKVLSPLFEQWLKTSQMDAEDLVAESGLQITDVDAASVKLANVHDKQYFAQFVNTISSTESTVRSGLVTAFFQFMRQNWNMWAKQDQVSAAQILFDTAYKPNEGLAAGAQDVLRSVDLSSETLATLLNQSRAGTSEVRGPPAKRRKRSSSGTSLTRAEAAKSVDDATAKIGLTLELVENNAPETKEELLNSMFEMLGTLKQLQQNRIDSPYLLNLCLSSINAMARSSRVRASHDTSGVKPEIVTDCLRAADNPQVQNTSLLVLAALSSVVPDKMVHNVMPIFTFISHNMLSKDDEHSINVINEAIDKIVPALLDNLRRGRNQQSYQTSMASMLASFTAAYDHIPLHRRVAFYQKLLHCVDIRESGYMLITLLAHQQRSDPALAKFMEELLSQVPATVQLLVYRQLLYLSADVLEASPKMAGIVFNIGRNTSVIEKSQYSTSILFAAIAILQSRSLAAIVSSVSKADTDDATSVWEDMQSAFESTLTAIRNTKKAPKQVSVLAKETLDHFLRLPSLSDLLEIVVPKLDELDEEVLRPQALRVLALQIERQQRRKGRALDVAMKLLDKLRSYIASSTSSPMLLATLACVDPVVENYGRKSAEAVAETAAAIVEKIDPSDTSDLATEQCLTAELLTLAGIIDVIKETAIPIVPGLMAKVLQTLAVNYDRKQFSRPIWKASCVLLSALFSHVAFMVPEPELAQVLTFIFASQTRITDGSGNADLDGLMNSMARKVDLEILVASSRTVLSELDADEMININGVGEVALSRSDSDRSSTSNRTLDLVSQALEASTKSIVIKQAGVISELFLNVLAQESVLISASTESNTPTSSPKLKEASIKFIYKVNDTVFRPLFESWTDWASDDQTRQIVLFNLLTHFFATLKAIVTSYASYLLKPISTILRAAGTPDKTSKTKIPEPLLTNTLTLLRTITTHDQDSFFAAPSHFEAIAAPLVSCLQLASARSTRSIVINHVIPAIVSLATSTLDSPNTHSTLTHHTVQLKSHSSSHVRLASIQTLLAMSEHEDMGDEFISNVVGVGVGEGEGARGGGGSVGEIMVYVNEMLEDDDEDVEQNVRKWVQVVRARVGEDVFEI